MKEVDEDAEEDESGEDDDEENGSCEENGGEKPVVKRDGTMVATAAVRSSTHFFGFYMYGLLFEKCFRSSNGAFLV